MATVLTVVILSLLLSCKTKKIVQKAVIETDLQTTVQSAKEQISQKSLKLDSSNQIAEKKQAFYNAKISYSAKDEILTVTYDSIIYNDYTSVTDFIYQIDELYLSNDTTSLVIDEKQHIEHFEEKKTRKLAFWLWLFIVSPLVFMAGRMIRKINLKKYNSYFLDIN